MNPSNGLRIDDLEEDEVLNLDDQTRPASPSTISTASSGSPLVRGNSSTGASKLNCFAEMQQLHYQKRPAPTSIAAAQLLCQQQRLEFDKLPREPMAAAKKSGKGKLPKPKPKQADCSRSESLNSIKKEQEAKGNYESNNGKSAGYNMAKAIAFKAYR